MKKGRTTFIVLMAAVFAIGAGPALVVAFLLATPELGVESFALSVRFLGWPFAVVRTVSGWPVAAESRSTSVAAEPMRSSDSVMDARIWPSATGARRPSAVKRRPHESAGRSDDHDDDDDHHDDDHHHQLKQRKTPTSLNAEPG